MKRIEVPKEWERKLGILDERTLGRAEGIAYANTQLANAADTPMPRLTDEEIEKELINTPSKNHAYVGIDRDSFILGARFVRDWYDKRLTSTIETWRPQKGDKCAFWMSSWDFTTVAEFVERVGDEYRYITFGYGDKDFAYHCAALESLDEIGKPPSYFIKRGRCTQGKEQS